MLAYFTLISGGPWLFLNQDSEISVCALTACETKILSPYGSQTSYCKLLERTVLY